MKDGVIKAKIFRFDPSRDAVPRYEIYEVPRKEEGMLVGDVLMYIYENIDPSLAFRWECRARQCGACGVMINGRPGLICKERAPDVMLLEPLCVRPVIRDLVIDIGRVADRLNPWFEMEKPGSQEAPVFPEENRKAYRQAEACIECYMCEAMCAVKSTNPDAIKEFAGPRRFARLSRNIYYPRDEADWVEIGAEYGLFNCVVCQFCNEVCPKEVNPADIIAELEYRVVGRNIDVSGVRKVKAWTDSIRRTAKAEGVRIRLKVKGLGALTDVSQAVRLALRKKLPWPFLRPKGIDQIQQIYRQVESEKQ